MTDFQFGEYIKLRDKQEEALQLECSRLREENAALKAECHHETGMTDLQFTAFLRLQDENAKLKMQCAQLQSKSPGDSGMTDYQFKRYEEYRDKHESLERECAELRAQLTELRQENASLQQR